MDWTPRCEDRLGVWSAVVWRGVESLGKESLGRRLLGIGPALSLGPVPGVPGALEASEERPPKDP